MQHHMMAHDWTLVFLSFAVAYFASFTALDMGTRLRRAVGLARKQWLAGSAVVLGGGIFSMHFIAMLALHTDVQIGYDFELTVLSLLLAIGFVGVGFHLVTRENASIVRQLGAGVIVGLGVSAMHYTGMAAVVLPGVITYNPLIVALSITIAVVAATAALWLTLNLQKYWQRAIAAGVMAVAVCGMHYTAMTAATIVLSPDQIAAVDPISRTLLAGSIAVAVFMILCLAMVGVFVDRRFELQAEREAESLRAANAALVESQAAVRNLLDNADQGFLTVGADLKVGDQFSAACLTLLGGSPAGESIIDLLCQNAPKDTGRDMRATLESLFANFDDFSRDLKLELLPAAFEVNGRPLKVDYKFLDDRHALMLIVTDVTETKRLTQEIERERQRLEMIVLAVAESETFVSLVDEYRAFLTHELPDLAERFETSVPSGELYRRLHTYKGLLAQFSFYWSPSAIHDVETVMAEMFEWTAESAREAFRPDALIEALDRDMASLEEVLGEDRMPSRGRATMSAKQLRTAAQSAREILQSEEGRAASPRLRKLLASLVEAGNVEVKAMLGLHARGVPALAAKLHKQVAPVLIEGDEVGLSPERYGAFFRTLVHVFRNAVDHGVEPPETRLEAGKPAEAAITCRVRDCGDAVEIEIADDGCGIDRATLEDKLIAAGKNPARIKAMALEDLVFFEGLSSRETAEETSGRGVGLAAVKAELDKLGGAVAARSDQGAGARFTFRIPKPSDETSTIADDRKVA
ncbi:MAG: MHYT domain-containing protein [Maricaulaceae bacterium]|jgi:NO-binding membrane sensor protein with MHYT domain/signal transduction histidine kinase